MFWRVLLIPKYASMLAAHFNLPPEFKLLAIFLYKDPLYILLRRPIAAVYGRDVCSSKMAMVLIIGASLISMGR